MIEASHSGTHIAKEVCQTQRRAGTAAADNVASVGHTHILIRTVAVFKPRNQRRILIALRVHALGNTCMLKGRQAALNVLVVTDTIPNTGISLPFFSYGGTALLMLLAQMGIMLSISRQSSVKKRVEKK